jgi:hypothetical protein
VPKVVDRVRQAPRRTQILWLSGGATAVFYLGLTLIERKLTSYGMGPTIFDLDLAGSAAAAEAIVLAWREGGGLDLARVSLWVDFGLILSYATFLATATLATRTRMLKLRLPTLAMVGIIAFSVAITAAFCDSAENVLWLLILDGRASDAASAATTLAIVKFAGIGFAIGYLLLGLGAWVFRRMSAINQSHGGRADRCTTESQAE